MGAVPIPINRSKAEIGAALITIQKKKTKIRAVLVNHLGINHKGKDRISEKGKVDNKQSATHESGISFQGVSFTKPVQASPSKNGRRPQYPNTALANASIENPPMKRVILLSPTQISLMILSMGPMG